MRTDDMVREALADLAPTAPADNTALAGMHRAIGRRRHRQQVARVAAAVAFVALAVGTTAVVLDAEGDPAQVSTDPDDTTTPTTTPTTPTTPTTTETTPSTPEGTEAGRIDFGPVSFQLPEGWVEVYREPRSSPFVDGDAEGEALCIAPAGNEGVQWDGCSGLLIHQGDFLPGNEGAAYQEHAPWAWYHNTDAAPCPTGPEGNEDYIQAPDGFDPIDQGFRSVGARTAYYDRWRAVCPQSGFSFEPEAWYLPDSRVVVFDVFGQAETEAFLASFEFDG